MRPEIRTDLSNALKLAKEYLPIGSPRIMMPKIFQGLPRCQVHLEVAVYIREICF
ncbi:MAG: hypothetical protein ABSA52_25335 [Candidatus Binatia bacterium]|jgi:hypothetical protein